MYSFPRGGLLGAPSWRATTSQDLACLNHNIMSSLPSLVDDDDGGGDGSQPLLFIRPPSQSFLRRPDDNADDADASQFSCLRRPDDSGPDDNADNADASQSSHLRRPDDNVLDADAGDDGEGDDDTVDGSALDELVGVYRRLHETRREHQSPQRLAPSPRRSERNARREHQSPQRLGVASPRPSENHASPLPDHHSPIAARALFQSQADDESADDESAGESQSQILLEVAAARRGRQRQPSKVAVAVARRGRQRRGSGSSGATRKAAATEYGSGSSGVTRKTAAR